jgi:plastocyanin
MTGNPALFFGLLTLVVFFAVGAGAMFALAPLVDTDAAVLDEGADGGPTSPGGATNTTILARNLTFDKRTITASVGGDVSVRLDNQDPGVIHNIAFYTSRNAATKIFVGETNTGGTINNNFKAPTTPGNYFFRCDAHPDQMTGTFVVK